MTGTEKQNVLTRVREHAKKLFSALDGKDYNAAAKLAEMISTAGVQSLDRLTPRGTLQFPAGNRWDDPLTEAVLDHLNHKLPEPITAQLLTILGYWAGEVTVPTIRRLLRERSRPGPSVETARTIQNGFHALHMIGGSRAVQVLCEFQGEEFPDKVREEAAWFLNELGARIVDSRFGSERAPDSAEEVRRRDSLEDPFSWRPATVQLLDYLISVGRLCLDEHRDALRSTLPAKEAETVSSAFSDGSSTMSWEGALLDALEPTVPQFMIRLAPSEVLALDSVVCFFPNSDVDSLTAIPNPSGWSRLGLLPGSMSAIHLDHLPLFDLGKCDVADDSRVRLVLWDWLGVPLHLARLFAKRKHYPLVFAMAAFEYHMQRKLEFVRGVPFPDVLQSIIKGATNHPQRATSVPQRGEGNAHYSLGEPSRDTASSVSQVMDESTSVSLLDRLRDHPSSEAAWARLDTVYRPYLLRWAGRFGLQEADAEDVVQDVLAELRTLLPGFQHNRQSGAFRTWLRRVLGNRVKAFLRWRFSSWRRARPVLAELEAEDSALVRLWDREHDEYLIRCVKEYLPRIASDRDAEVFKLAVAGELTTDEIAGRFGITRVAVYQIKSRVLRQLRAEFQGLVDLD